MFDFLVWILTDFCSDKRTKLRHSGTTNSWFGLVGANRIWECAFEHFFKFIRWSGYFWRRFWLRCYSQIVPGPGFSEKVLRVRRRASSRQQLCLDRLVMRRRQRRCLSTHQRRTRKSPKSYQQRSSRSCTTQTQGNGRNWGTVLPTSWFLSRW